MPSLHGHSCMHDNHATTLVHGQATTCGRQPRSGRAQVPWHACLRSRLCFCVCPPCSSMPPLCRATRLPAATSRAPPSAGQSPRFGAHPMPAATYRPPALHCAVSCANTTLPDPPVWRLDRGSALWAAGAGSQPERHLRPCAASCPLRLHPHPVWRPAAGAHGVQRMGSSCGRQHCNGSRPRPPCPP